ncbi:TetR-like C-terminal domain-containing protein [Cohnella panacarvi]|uniref:TetR-like C-terminal domain-containing protein n=1 Tax=Cohnella panacarvi TaxID=400776 RepID=UPI00047EE6DE|nr:TetR-like C-terminal domain-containing protein [Cohnella panacarvi]
MRAGIKPDAVIAAAAEIADLGGWNDVTPSNVAARLGIKTPSLYNHISGQDDLRQRLAVHASRQLLERMIDAAVGQSGKTAIVNVGSAYVRFVREHPGLYEATYRVGMPRPPEYEQIAQDILRLLYRLLEPFRLTDEEAVHAVRGLRSLLHGFASLEASGGFQMPVDKDASLTRIISRYMDGFHPEDL